MRFGSLTSAVVAILACSEAGLATFTVRDRASIIIPYIPWRGKKSYDFFLLSPFPLPSVDHPKQNNAVVDVF